MGSSRSRNSGSSESAAAQLELLLPVGEVAHTAPPHGLELQKVDDPLHLLPMLDLPRLLASPVETTAQNAASHVDVPAEHQVVQHRHVLEQLDVLERTGDPQPGDAVRCEAVDTMRPALTVRERDRALLGPVQPAQTVEQARLARTVGTDQRLKGATTKRQGDVVESRHSPEAEREPVDANLGRSGSLIVGEDEPSPDGGRNWSGRRQGG